MSERLTNEQLRNVDPIVRVWMDEAFALRARVAQLEAALASAYREIKRLQQKSKDAGLIVGYGPDTPVFDE